MEYLTAAHHLLQRVLPPGTITCSGGFRGSGINKGTRREGVLRDVGVHGHSLVDKRLAHVLLAMYTRYHTALHAPVFMGLILIPETCIGARTWGLSSGYMSCPARPLHLDHLSMVTCSPSCYHVLRVYGVELSCIALHCRVQQVYLLTTCSRCVSSPTTEDGKSRKRPWVRSAFYSARVFHCEATDSSDQLRQSMAACSPRNPYN
ncbi:hypothetical protein K504DRAFT_25775 [Pleomassaria siparia CBS 279.74]|uniref:Uncharacterized protein n=1 Tax=Pleomassaria siparia CBS 279.74 TaxID=1314801 RepID=A0A6G1KRZ8_9PLEO|nr:hypothetical protein K504DRAFT_25775 [Pleomassaria siparia CBS 279.74]